MIKGLPRTKFVIIPVFKSNDTENRKNNFEDSFVRIIKKSESSKIKSVV